MSVLSEITDCDLLKELRRRHANKMVENPIAACVMHNTICRWLAGIRDERGEYVGFQAFLTQLIPPCRSRHEWDEMMQIAYTFISMHDDLESFMEAALDHYPREEFWQMLKRTPAGEAG